MSDATDIQNAEELLDYYEEVGEAWLSLVSADGWPYLLTSTEGGDVFVQTFPMEREEGDGARGATLDSGARMLEAMPASFYPIEVVAAG